MTICAGAIAQRVIDSAWKLRTCKSAQVFVHFENQASLLLLVAYDRIVIRASRFLINVQCRGDDWIPPYRIIKRVATAWFGTAEMDEERFQFIEFHFVGERPPTVHHAQLFRFLDLLDLGEELAWLEF